MWLSEPLPSKRHAARALTAFALVSTASHAQEVVVQGRAPHSPRDPTAASTVISGERLQRPGATASSVLGAVPGVELARTGAGSDLATASLRGATSAQTPVYLAGVRLNDDVTGTADLSTVPLSVLDRVEVFRGSAPEHADQLGPGGAVFFEPRLPRASEARGGLMLGSFGARSGWMSAALAGSGSAALFAIRRDAAQNDYPYVDDAGTRFDATDDRRVTRDNADFESYDAWAIGRHRLGREGRVVTLLEAFDREQGVTGVGPRPALRARARTRRELAALSSVVPCGAVVRTRSCRVELVTSALRARTAIEDPGFELSLQSDAVSSAGKRLSQRGRLALAPIDRLELGLSIEASIERLDVLRAQTGGSFDVHALREETRSIVSARYDVVRPITLFALGVVERRCLEADEDARCSEVDPGGRLGASVALADWLSVLGNLALTSRAPLLGELYGVAPLVRGNPALRPERSTSGDLGLRAGSGVGELRAYLEAFAFRRTARDLIAYTSSFRQTVPYNVGRARFDGVELSGRGELGAILRLDLALTLLDARDTTPRRMLANDVLPFHAGSVISGRAELGTETRIPRIDRLSLGIGAHHRASRYADRAGLIVIPEESRVDLEAQAELFSRRLAARAALDDVFDAARWDIVGAPLPGRTFFVSVEAKLP